MKIDAHEINKKVNQSKPTLVFVYNAQSGIFNALTDLAHKTFSPKTYQCNLCALTYSTFSMNKSWKQFLETLNCDFEFLHADELKAQYNVSNTPLPAVFVNTGAGLKLQIGADTINGCKTLEDLKELISSRLPTNLARGQT